jgi:hypothetical protein
MSYQTAHVQVRRLKGRARNYPCVDSCGREAEHWSYSGNAPDERTDDRGRCYSLNVEFYVPRCHRCHARYDAARRAKRLEDNDVTRPKDKRFNWSIRLTQDEAVEWDALLYALCSESGVRALKKTDVVRGLMGLVDDPQVRAKLLRVLKVAA